MLLFVYRCDALCRLCENYIFVGKVAEERLLKHLEEANNMVCYCGIPIVSTWIITLSCIPQIRSHTVYQTLYHFNI